MASSSSSFLDHLTWLRCLSCGTEFNREKKFLLFSCQDVFCYGCAVRMLSPTQQNHVFCRICKNTVAAVRIDENMPSNVRNLFMQGSTSAAEMIRVQNCKLRFHTITNDIMREQCDNYERLYERQHRIYEELENESANNIGACESMRRQLLEVMPKERLEYLLSLYGDNINALKRMTASELIGDTNDGRQPGSSIVTSTPYWSQPRQRSSLSSKQNFNDDLSNFRTIGQPSPAIGSLDQNS